MGLIRILIFLGIGVIVLLLYKKFMGLPRSGGEHPEMDDDRLGRLVQDPQCMVYVDVRDAIRRKVPDGDLYFCSRECADQFMGAEGGRKGKTEQEKGGDAP